MLKIVLTSLSVCLVCCSLTYILIRRYLKKNIRPEEILIKLKVEVEELIQDMNQTTERNLILLEDHIEKLKNLLAESEKAGTLLKRETERNKTSKMTYSHLKNSEAAKVKVQQDLFPAAEETKKEQNPPVQRTETEEEKRIPDVKKDRNALRERVLELQKQGVSAHTIAENLDVPVGEVELIISIYARK